MKGATLHHDEFLRRDFTAYTHLDPDEKLAINQSLIPSEPELSQGRRIVIHDKRIDCPAKNIPRLIPKVLSILTETARAADFQIKNRQRY